MESTTNKLMVYGANGYSAQLIIEELISKNIKPVLAGRNASRIIPLADKFKCEYRIFDLDNDELIEKYLEDVHTLINCAGPFRKTAKDLMEACLQSKTNYLDITGEIPVFHLAFSLAAKAKERGVTFLPGVGFDIIPTDCVAKKLSEQMKDASELKLGFLNIGGGISRGTLLTTLEFLGGNGFIRKNSNVVESKIGAHTINFTKNNFSFYGISIPWGDVYTSYYSTGIPNVEIYLGLSRIVFILRNILLLAVKIFKTDFVKRIASNYVSKNLSGPPKNKRDSTETYVWGKVKNERGEMIETAYRFMEGYNLTAKGAAEAAERVLKNSVPPGTFTPSLAFGSDFMDLFVLKKIF
jgi:short subunit dehydrogenase-like uncharacterized protein